MGQHPTRPPTAWRCWSSTGEQVVTCPQGQLGAGGNDCPSPGPATGRSAATCGPGPPSAALWSVGVVAAGGARRPSTRSRDRGRHRRWLEIAAGGVGAADHSTAAPSRARGAPQPRTRHLRPPHENLVWVSPSTLYRVLAAQGLVLPARPQRTRRRRGPCRTGSSGGRWIYDITHCRPRRLRHLVVTRKWLATLVTAEETATQVEVVFTDALDAEGLWPAVEARQAQRARHGDDSDQEPILLVMSDNGPQMRAGTTREFWALCSIAARFGRPGTPTDQAWIETLFGHVKTEWPHLEKITDPNTLRAELATVRGDYNTRRLHASSATSPPTTNTKAEVTPSARPDETASTGPASPASPTIATTTKTSHEHTRPMRRNQTPQNGHLLRSTFRQRRRPTLTHQRRLKPAPTCNTPTGATLEHGYRNLTFRESDPRNSQAAPVTKRPHKGTLLWSLSASPATHPPVRRRCSAARF